MSHDAASNDTTQDGVEAMRTQAAAESRMSIEERGILRSIDRDLQFYRSRLYTTYSFILVVQLLVLAAQRSNTMAFIYPWVEDALFVGFFLAIWTVSYLLRRSYVKRTTYLRGTRSRLVVQATGVDPYTAPGGGEHGYGPFAWGPSVLILAVITVFTVIGIVTGLAAV